MCHIGCCDFAQNLSGGVANPASLRWTHRFNTAPDIPACCPTPQRLSLSAQSLRPRPDACARRRNDCARLRNDFAREKKATPCGPMIAPNSLKAAPVSTRSALRSPSMENPFLSLKAINSSTDGVQGLPCGDSQRLVSINKASLALQEQVSSNS